MHTHVDMKTQPRGFFSAGTCLPVFGTPMIMATKTLSSRKLASSIFFKLGGKMLEIPRPVDALVKITGSFLHPNMHIVFTHVLRKNCQQGFLVETLGNFYLVVK
jgi:hypothetical protein